MDVETGAQQLFGVDLDSASNPELDKVRRWVFCYSNPLAGLTRPLSRGCRGFPISVGSFLIENQFLRGAISPGSALARSQKFRS